MHWDAECLYISRYYIVKRTLTMWNTLYKSYLTLHRNHFNLSFALTSTAAMKLQLVCIIAVTLLSVVAARSLKEVDNDEVGNSLMTNLPRNFSSSSMQCKLLAGNSKVSIVQCLRHGDAFEISKSFGEIFRSHFWSEEISLFQINLLILLTN